MFKIYKKYYINISIKLSFFILRYEKKTVMSGNTELDFVSEILQFHYKLQLLVEKQNLTFL